MYKFVIFSTNVRSVFRRTMVFISIVPSPLVIAAIVSADSGSSCGVGASVGNGEVVGAVGLGVTGELVGAAVVGAAVVGTAVGATGAGVTGD